MSELKVGKPLLPFTSNIFDGNAGSNLAALGVVDSVHRGQTELRVFKTVYEAWNAGLRIGDMYGLGQKFQTGLENFGEEPIGPPGLEHAKEVMEEIVEPIGEGHEGEVIEPIGEKPEPEEGEVSIAANVEGCETVVYEIRILTPFEAALCEAKDSIVGIETMRADSVVQDEIYANKAKEASREADVLDQELDVLKSQRDQANEQLQKLKEDLDTAEAKCASAKKEGSGKSACKDLTTLLSEGVVSKIADLEVQISQLDAEIKAVRAQYQAQEEVVAELKGLRSAASKLNDELKFKADAMSDTLTKAEDNYISIGQGVASGIGEMNSLAVGRTSISSACSGGQAAECCELNPEQVDQLMFLQKLLAEGGAPKEA